MLKNIIKLLNKIFRTQSHPTLPLDLPRSTPYLVRVSIPVAANSEHWHVRFLIKSDEPRISYSKIMDKICSLDNDDYSVIELENVLDTMIAVEQKDRHLLNKILDYSGIKCPVALKLEDGSFYKDFVKVEIV